VVGTAGVTALATPIVAAVPLLSAFGFGGAGIGSDENCCIRCFSALLSHHFNTHYPTKKLINVSIIGTIAAGIHSTIGNGVFATLQSAGAGGAGLAVVNVPGH
jgi:hypothetical protein